MVAWGWQGYSAAGLLYEGQEGHGDRQASPGLGPNDSLQPCPVQYPAQWALSMVGTGEV